jgi:hypothetical protein
MFWPQWAHHYVLATVCTPLCFGHSEHTIIFWPQCAHHRLGHSVHTLMFWPQCAHCYVLATVGTPLCFGHSVPTVMSWPQWAHQHGLATVCTPTCFGHSERSISNKLHKVWKRYNFSTLSQPSFQQTIMSVIMNSSIFNAVCTVHHVPMCR